MKKAARRIAIATFALMASAGVVSMPSAADADSAWPLPRTTVPHSAQR